MTRKRRGSGGRSGGGGHRRTVPSESTGREDEFLRELVDSGRPIEVVLVGTGSVSGALSEFGADALVLRDGERGTVRIMRRDIRVVVDSDQG